MKSLGGCGASVHNGLAEVYIFVDGSTIPKTKSLVDPGLNFRNPKILREVMWGAASSDEVLTASTLQHPSTSAQREPIISISPV